MSGLPVITFVLHVHSRTPARFIYSLAMRLLTGSAVSSCIISDSLEQPTRLSARADGPRNLMKISHSRAIMHEARSGEIEFTVEKSRP
jgi:hypothetical protein